MNKSDVKAGLLFLIIALAVGLVFSAIKGRGKNEFRISQYEKYDELKFGDKYGYTNVYDAVDSLYTLASDEGNQAQWRAFLYVSEFVEGVDGLIEDPR